MLTQQSEGRHARVVLGGGGEPMAARDKWRVMALVRVFFYQIILGEGFTRPPEISPYPTS